MQVKEVMSHHVSCCNANTPLDQMAMLMWNSDCGFLPITDDAGHPVGIVTDRDIAMAGALNHKPLWELNGATLAGHNPIYTCQPEDDIKIALNQMLQHKVRRLPVIGDNGTISGVLSIDDIVACAERGRRGLGTPELSYDDAMVALKAVVKHH